MPKLFGPRHPSLSPAMTASPIHPVQSPAPAFPVGAIPALVPPCLDRLVGSPLSFLGDSTPRRPIRDRPAHRASPSPTSPCQSSPLRRRAILFGPGRSATARPIPITPYQTDRADPGCRFDACPTRDRPVVPFPAMPILASTTAPRPPRRFEPSPVRPACRVRFQPFLDRPVGACPACPRGARRTFPRPPRHASPYRPSASLAFAVAVRSRQS